MISQFRHRPPVTTVALRRVLNVSDLSGDSWNWLVDAWTGKPELSWQHFSSTTISAPRFVEFAGKQAGWARAVNANKAVRSATDDILIVTHGPWPAMHVGLVRGLHRRPIHHLAYAFTFTSLPTGAKRAVMARAFRHIDRFVSFSTTERDLYARHFGIDPVRLDMQHWPARPPPVTAGPPIIAGDYISAVGSQGRDYRPLIAAMRKLPNLRLVIVADPASVEAGTLPVNVTLINGIPLADAMNIMQHSRFTAICLRDAEVPCGHSSIVAAMHLSKAIACTASSGVNDYVYADRTGVLVPSGDPLAWQRAIERLQDDTALRLRLGLEAQAFAQDNCSEQSAVAYLRSYMQGVPWQKPTQPATAFAPASTVPLDPKENSLFENYSTAAGLGEKGPVEG